MRTDGKLLSRRQVLSGGVATFPLIAAGMSASVFAAPSIDLFIEGLLRRMSLADKAGQLSIYRDLTRPLSVPDNPTDAARHRETLLADIAAGRVTGLFNGIGAASARTLQIHAITKSPLRIPMIFAADVIHGLHTVFPIPLAEASAFDPDLAQRTARATAVEATASGLHWTFAPMVDVARDQRWGRVAEGAGEDVFLGCVLARARVRGFQRERLDAYDSLLACPKHFAGYGAVMGGMEYNTVDISEITLRQTHLPPFKAAFDAGALTTMSSFSDLGGIPATGNKHLLTDILRGEMGFSGLVVSDFQSDKEMIAHGYAADEMDAAAKAILAGCDISMNSGFYNRHLPQLVADGRVPVEVVDTAVRRVLRVKKALGLFDDPFRSMAAKRKGSEVRTPERLALAREAARKSIVLLKNNSSLLPLPKTGKRLALIGPFAADRENLFGPWSLFADPSTGVTLGEGMRRAVSDPKDLVIERGCDFEAAIECGLDAALAAARRADVIVLAIGESANMSGEAQARTEIVVPAVQQELVEAIAALRKPMVVILRHGRALALKGAVREADAILATWFLGSETGHAIADILFGDYEPTGRLPVSFPQESGQEPYFYDHRQTGRPQVSPDVPNFKARYREVTFEALYPFGHGLGYSSVAYGPTQASAPTLDWTGSITVEAEISNTGSRPTRSVAQLYVRDLAASITQPVRSLRGFKAVMLQPGEIKRVSFTLDRHDLELITAASRRSSEPGRFDIWVAPSASGGTAVRIALEGPSSERSVAS